MRVVIYTISTVSATVGACLIKAGGRSSSYADGTSGWKISIGNIIFCTSLAILCINVVWGILRWFLRGYAEKWKPSRLIGKLIGGGIWRIMAFGSLVLVSAIIIAPMLLGVLGKPVTKDIAPISLTEGYDRLLYINDNLETLDFSELRDELCGLLLCNIDFGLDASSNITSHQSFFFRSTYAYSPTVTTLNKAILSGDGHFVVFYTDTGDDKISDEDARRLAAMLEDIISRYNEVLGFDYGYKKFENNVQTALRMRFVLTNSGINDKIMDTAMPIYVVNPYENDSRTLASYAGKRFKDLGASILMRLGALFGEETAVFYSKTPSFPFVNILPENIKSESLPAVTAHEIGHHYAALYNDSTYGKTGSDDDFIDETGPNWMSINVLPNQPVDSLINGYYYNDLYLGSTGDPIDKVAIRDLDGYPAVAFLQNYYEIVPDAKTIIMDAIYHGDALNYLYSHAGPDYFREVMTSLAERNLTGEYGGKLTNTATPIGKSLGCAGVCWRSFSVNRAATGYVYFSANDYLGMTLKYKSRSDGTSASLLGKNNHGGWAILRSGQTEIEFEFNEETAKEYEVLALAVANSSISESGDYIVDVGVTEIEYVFSEFYSETNPGCYEIDTNALFNNLATIADAKTDFLDALSKLGEKFNPELDLSSARMEHQEEADEAKRALSEARGDLASYKITACEKRIDNRMSFAATKAKIQSALGDTINIINLDFGDEKLSVFVGFDLLKMVGKFYLLTESGRGIILTSISAEGR